MSDRIGFGLTTRVLDIHPRVSGPRHSIYPVTGPGLSRLPKEVIADPAEFIEANTLGVPPHLFHQVVDRSHSNMISVLISQSRAVRTGYGKVGRRLTTEISGQSKLGRGFRMQAEKGDHPQVAAPLIQAPPRAA